MINADQSQLEKLVLHHELHRFFCQYFDVCEAPLLDEYSNYFAADGQFNMYVNRGEERASTPTVSIRGPAGIRDMTETALVNLEQTHHTMGNFWVNIEDGQVIARAHLRAYHRAKGFALGKDEESLSTFTAAMVQENGRWKIARFDYVLYIVLGSFEAFPEVEKLVQNR
jgi:3-phenylpropionate/cinnamic acid dioxygenase small subunit